MPGDAASSVGQVFSTVGQRVLTMHPGDEEGRMLRSPGLRTAGMGTFPVRAYAVLDPDPAGTAGPVEGAR